MIVDVSKTDIVLKNEKELFESSKAWYKKIMSGDEDFTGWATLPQEFNQDLLNDIMQTAEIIKNNCKLFVVIGVGGSYLGAKAVIEALNGSAEDFPEVMFAGFNMSASYLKKVMSKMDNDETCLCVISKSGTTVEPLLSYSILSKKMYDKYGEEANKRIYVITDEEKGKLREEVRKFGHKSFVVPDDIGGRYSVLSPVGLLPIAVAGHDIERLLQGAKDISFENGWTDDLLNYAVCRNALHRQGKTNEIFEFFEHKLKYFGEWLKQLFGESEGKDGKGTYPSTLCFSTDLHSIGQFLQQGNQLFYEVVLRVMKSESDLVIPDSAVTPYAGKTLETINKCAEEGVIAAHKKVGIPIITIEIPVLDEYNLGKLIYYFEMTCAISAYNLGVSPFNQPGVEAYKNEMRAKIKDL